MWASKPRVDLTLLAVWMPVFSCSQLKKDSIGWRVLEMAVDRSLSAASRCFSPLVFLGGGMPNQALSGVGGAVIRLVGENLQRVR